MSMITEQVERLREIANDIEKHGKDAFVSKCDLLEAATTIEQLEAKVRKENGGGWIPIAEPIPDKEVLCCNQRQDMLIGYLFEDEESYTGYSAEGDNCYLMDCVAWMPLPEPYKEGK